MGVTASPEQIGKKQNDYKGAAGFVLLEEPGQEVAKNKDFESVCQGGDHRPKRAESSVGFWRRGSEERNEDRCHQGENKQDHRLGDHSLARCRSRRPVFFAHEDKIAFPVSDGRDKSCKR
jgi:hypothetical protein